MSTCCVELWGLDLQASYEHAFGAIRQLALSLRAALGQKTEDAYKEGPAPGARRQGRHTRRWVELCGVCAIRQLALSLRAALGQKTEDAYKEAASAVTEGCPGPEDRGRIQGAARGLNCLELWSKVLGAHADKQELRPLVYPLTQLLLGAARLVPTPRFFPLRLRLLRSVNR
eukprot:gene22462-29578_t